MLISYSIIPLYIPENAIILDEPDTTERLNWTELNWTFYFLLKPILIYLHSYKYLKLICVYILCLKRQYMKAY